MIAAWKKIRHGVTGMLFLLCAGLAVPVPLAAGEMTSGGQETGFVWDGMEVGQETEDGEGATSDEEEDYNIIEGKITQDILDFSELDDFMQVEGHITFSELWKMLVNKEEGISVSSVADAFKGLVVGSFQSSRKILFKILILAMAFSVLHNFANAFQNSQVGMMSYYMISLVLLYLLMNSFMAISDLMEKALSTLMGFMNCLLPTFTLALVFSNGQASALGFYEMTLLIIYIVEWGVLNLLLPAVHIYVILLLLNQITMEERLQHLTDLIKNGVNWSLKIVFTAVIGMNVVQGLLNPAIDQYKRSLMSKGLSALPGVGNTIQSVVELLYSTGTVIRGGVGAASLVLLILLCASPCIQMTVMAVLYKLAAAVMEPVVDKRISGSVAGVGDGVMLLLKSLITVMLLFFVTIAIVCTAAGVIS